MKRSLLIFGKKWKVRMKTKALHEKEECFGLCDPDTKTIFVKSGMSKAHTERVFWHEYFHARLYESGVVLNAGGISDLAEEIICDTFADLMTLEVNVKWK